MERFLVRLVLRNLGLGGSVLALAFSLLSVTGVLGLIFFVCMGGLCGLGIVDVATSSTVRATVTGHHWERQIWPQVAKLDRKGNIYWSTQPSVEREGDDLWPLWPSVPDDHCSFVGCQRQGSRQEKYELRLKMADGRAETCLLDESAWKQFAVGSALSVQVGGITGAVTCRSATPEQAPAPAPAPVKRRPKNRRGV
jgi:hypothetical protein